MSRIYERNSNGAEVCVRPLYRINYALLLLAILAAAAIPQDDGFPRRHGSNPNYRPGDWVSYGVTRYVTSVATGPQEVYFGTTGGMTRYDLFQDRWNAPVTVSDGLAANLITAVAFDASTGFLWCGTSEGVSFLHPSANQWTNIFKDEMGVGRYDDILSIGFGDLDVWLETRSSTILQGSKFGGVITRAVRGDQFSENIQWFGARVRRPAEFPQFFMSRGYLFDPRGDVQDFHLRNAEVTVAVNDGWGKMWLGTWGLGALKADLQVERAEALEFGLANSRVDAIALTKDGLWMGGQANENGATGITRWDQRRSHWEYFDTKYNREIANDEINNFAVAGEKIYCATRYGVAIYDSRKDRWHRVTVFDGLEKENVNDVAVDANYLWVASDGGLNRVSLKTIDKDTLDVIEISPNDLHLVPVYDLEKVENLLWAATDEGAYVFDATKNTGGYVTDLDGPHEETVTAVSRYENEIWFGTLRAIEAYDMNKKVWLGSPVRQIFIPYAVNCLVADSAVVWAGTNQGVMRYNRRTQEWRRYTIEDGLMDNQVNAIAMDGDVVWFGTNSGLTAFRWRSPGRVD